MKNRNLLLLTMFVITSFLSLYILPPINASESLTLNPIANSCVSNVGAGEEYLTVRYEEGLKWVTYFAFNLSEIPSGASVDSAVLKIKTKLALNSAWVSAYSSSNAEWSTTGMSWDTKPNVDNYFDAVWVTANEEWYTWESSSFKDAVSDAFRETGKLTVMLRSGLLIDQTGWIIFYPDAKLEVTYAPEKKTPDLALSPVWAIVVAVIIFFGALIIAVIAIIYLVRKRQNRRTSSKVELRD